MNDLQTRQQMLEGLEAEQRKRESIAKAARAVSAKKTALLRGVVLQRLHGKDGA